MLVLDDFSGSETEGVRFKEMEITGPLKGGSLYIIGLKIKFVIANK